MVTATELKECKNCAELFEPKRAWQVYCDKLCQRVYWTRLRETARTGLVLEANPRYRPHE